MDTFGQRVRQLRTEAGETQQELANIIGGGFTKQGISKIERTGVIKSSGETVLAIAGHYRVALRWLMTGKGTPGAAPSQHTLDPGLVRTAARALHKVYTEELHIPYDIVEEPEMFAHLYSMLLKAREDAEDEASHEAWQWLGARMQARKTAQGASSNDDGRHKRRRHGAGHG